MGGCQCQNEESDYELYTKSKFTTRGGALNFNDFSNMNTRTSTYLSQYYKDNQNINININSKLKELLALKLYSIIGPQFFYMEITYQDFDSELRRNPFAFPIIIQLTPELMKINYDRDIEFPDVNPIKVVEPSGEVQYFQGSYNSRGQCHGKGVWTKDGNIYIGNFRNDEFNGTGLFINNKGDYYFGGWENSQCTGEGYIVSNRKLAYKGTFREGKKDGLGEEYYVDGDYYKGEFFNNQKHGKGKYIFADGSFFDGYFRDSKYSGQGRMVFRGGNMVDGEFLNGELNGTANFIWANGNRFNGTFVNNKKQGNGEYIFFNGKSFKGYWNNDQISGNGVVKDLRTTAQLNIDV